MSVKDVAEALKKNGSAALAQTEVIEKGPPLIDDAAELAENLPPMPEPVIDGMLHRGWKMVLGGSSKSFKTWSLINLAVSVAAGKDWLGLPTKQGHVLYINLENQRAGFARRLRAILDARGIKLAPDMLRVWNLRGHSSQSAKLIGWIIEEAKRQSYALIVIDPFYKLAAGRDENAAGEVAIALEPLDRIAEETGAAVLYGHHFSKGSQAGKDAIDRMSGSGVFARDADCIVTLTRHEEDDAFTVDAILRECAPIKSFVIRWEYPLMRRDGDLDPERLKQPQRGPGKKYTEEQLLEILDKQGELTTAEWKAAAMEDVGMSDGKFGALKRELVFSKRVYKSQLSEKWSKR